MRMSKDQRSSHLSTSIHDEKPEAQVLETQQQSQPSTNTNVEQRHEACESSTATDTEIQEDLKPAATTLNEKERLSNEEKSKPRQVIAVSASRGPAAFFNLARKFLVTDEMCDLSALEGAIVSAVDAAHLLERSKLANIVRVQTSYVTVEPKRRKQQAQSSSGPGGQGASGTLGKVAMPSEGTVDPAPMEPQSAAIAPGTSSVKSGGAGKVSSSTSGGRELRRARIVITVKRTESYKHWLEENPLQAIIAGDGAEDDPCSESGVQQGERAL